VSSPSGQRHRRDAKDEIHVVLPEAGSGLEAHPFEILHFLLTSGADIHHHVETDRNEGTQLNALFMSLRERKFHLTRFLVEHGADVDATLRVVRLDLPSVHESTEDEERVVDEDGDATWFRRLGLASFCEEEAAYAADELERLRATLKAALVARHDRAKRMIQTVLQVAMWMGAAYQPRCCISGVAP
jgi:hypothetical protein